MSPRVFVPMERFCGRCRCGDPVSAIAPPAHMTGEAIAQMRTRGAASQRDPIALSHWWVSICSGHLPNRVRLIATCSVCQYTYDLEFPSVETPAGFGDKP